MTNTILLTALAFSAALSASPVLAGEQLATGVHLDARLPDQLDLRQRDRGAERYDDHALAQIDGEATLYADPGRTRSNRALIEAQSQDDARRKTDNRSTSRPPTQADLQAGVRSAIDARGE